MTRSGRSPRVYQAQDVAAGPAHFNNRSLRASRSLGALSQWTCAFTRDRKAPARCRPFGAARRERQTGNRQRRAESRPTHGVGRCCAHVPKRRFRAPSTRGARAGALRSSDALGRGSPEDRSVDQTVASRFALARSRSRGTRLTLLTARGAPPPLDDTLGP
jgi:hypothetical protein